MNSTGSGHRHRSKMIADIGQQVSCVCACVNLTHTVHIYHFRARWSMRVFTSFSTHSMCRLPKCTVNSPFTICTFQHSSNYMALYYSREGDGDPAK